MKALFCLREWHHRSVSFSSPVLLFMQRTNPEAGGKRYRDFLDILLLARDEEGVGLSDTEIREEVDTFLFEGKTSTIAKGMWE